MKQKKGHTELVTGPSTEPITKDEAKTHERVDTSAEDSLITSMIAAAREWAEDKTQQVFITQTWKVYHDSFPSTEKFVLPKPPLQSVSHVKYFLEDDTEKTFDSSKYRVNTAAPKGEIVLKEGETWPNEDLKSVNAVEVQFDAGFGDGAGDVPDSIKHALKILVGHFYENREAVVSGEVPRTVEMTVDSLLNTEKRYSLV